MTSPYPEGFKSVTGSYVQCESCKANKKSTKDCQRCIAKTKQEKSLKQIRDLKNIMDRNKEEIYGLKIENQDYEEQIEIIQDENEINKRQITENEERINRNILQITQNRDELNFLEQALYNRTMLSTYNYVDVDIVTQKIEALKIENKHYEEQIEIFQDENEINKRRITENEQNIKRNTVQIKKNTDRINLIELSLYNDQLILDIERLESKYGPEVLSDDVRIHDGKFNGKPATLETHCTIVRVTGHLDVYFGHVTLVISRVNDTDYTWHYGVKTRDALPDQLNRKYWQTYVAGQTKYDAGKTRVSNFGKFKKIKQDITLLDMMKSHFEDCITFFYRKKEWPPNQIWDEKYNVFSGEPADVTLQRLKQFKLDEDTLMKGLKTSQHTIELTTQQIEHQRLVEQEIEQRKEEEEYIKTEQARKQQLRMENLRIMEQLKEDKRKRKLAAAAFNATENVLKAEAAAADSAKGKAAAATALAAAETAKAAAETAKAAAEALSKTKAAEAALAKKAAEAEAELAKKAEDDAISLLLKRALVQSNLERARLEQAEEAAIREKPTLNIPLMVSKSKSREVLDSRRNARTMIGYYQKLIDKVYIRYTDLKNITSVTDFNTEYDKFKLYCIYVSKYYKKVKEFPNTKDPNFMKENVIVNEDLKLIISEQEKALKFFENKAGRDSLRSITDIIIEKYCKTIADYVTQSQEFIRSKESMKDIEKASKINRSLVTYKNELEKIARYFGEKMSSRPTTVSIPTIEIIEQTIRILDRYLTYFSSFSQS
jgi:hypothetical protein